MTDEDIKKLRGVIKQEIGTALRPVNKGLKTVNTGLKAVKKDLKSVDRKLDILWDQTDRLTKNIVSIEDTLNSHTTALTRIEVKIENDSENIRKLDKRLTTSEAHLGIAAPPELTLVR